MKVTFTKTGTSRTTVSIIPRKGPAPLPRSAPGDAHMPTDLARFVVEEQFGIRHGFYGRLSSTDTGSVTSGGHDRAGRGRRTTHRLPDATHPDAVYAERLVALCLPLWRARAGLPPTMPAFIDLTLATPFDVDRVLHRLDDVSARWSTLEPGESITLDWPSRLAATTGGVR